MSQDPPSQSTLDEVSVRPAVIEDIPQILEIERKVHPAPWTQEAFSKELEKPYSQFLVLTDDETDSQFFGYIVYWSLTDPWQLLNIGIAPRYQRLGLAKKFMQLMIRDASRQGIRGIVLEVRKSNHPAISLYVHYGFQLRHIKKSYYSNGEDAYVFELQLSENQEHLDH